MRISKKKRTEIERAIDDVIMKPFVDEHYKEESGLCDPPELWPDDKRDNFDKFIELSQTVQKAVNEILDS